MITLITGVPGAGKTALAISMLEGEADRLLLVDGIPELKVPHEPLPEVARWTEYVADESQESGKKLVFAFAPDSLILIDEAQRHYRVRAASSKVPDHVAALETHRHQGLDFWLLTQHPGLIDPNVRKLVSRHIHLRSTFMGRQLFEWVGIGEPDSRGSREIAAKRSFKLPKRVFARYKSAEVHTKVPRRVPMYAYVLGFAVVSITAASIYMYRRIDAQLHPEKKAAATAAATQERTTGASGSVTYSYIGGYQPRVAGLPHTAPIYDALTQPQVAPWPQACMTYLDECRCYTSAGVRLRGVEQAACETIVRDGYFDAQIRVQPFQVAPGGAGGGGLTLAPSPPAVAPAVTKPTLPGPR